jgi:hypothetical protein
MVTFGFDINTLWGASSARNVEIAVDDGWWFQAAQRMTHASEELVNLVIQTGDKARAFLQLIKWFMWLRETYPTKISCRIVLQTLGTEWGRNVDPIMWCRYAYEVRNEIAGGKRYNQIHGVYEIDGMDVEEVVGQVIPDHRFKNELEYSHDRGAYVIRLRRLAHVPKDVGVAGHVSEQEQKGIPDTEFDLVLELEEFPVKDGALVGFREAMDKVMEDKPWTKGRGTVVRVAPLS